MTETTDDGHNPADAQDDRVVYLVDDDPDFLSSLAELLRTIDLSVEAYASPDAFLHGFVPERAGCIVLDIRLPRMSGLELYDHLVSKGVQTPVIILTGFAEVSTAVQALKNGVVEYLEKVTSSQVLLDHVQHAMRSDMERRTRIEAARETREHYEQLTPRERQILSQVARGLTSQQIADNLRELKRKTVEAHRARIMRKMKATNVAGLVRKYLELCQTGVVDVLPEEIPPSASGRNAPSNG